MKSRKQQKPIRVKFNDGWCFALVNGRLGEIYFRKKIGVYAHCYIKRKEYSKREQKMIDTDIKRARSTYRNGYYFDQIRKIKRKVPNRKKIFPDVKRWKTLGELKKSI